MFKTIVLVLLGIALAGCADFESRYANRFASADDAKCQSFGPRPGTQAYYNCRMDLERQRTIRNSMGVGF